MPPALYTFGVLLLMLTRKVESVTFEQSLPQLVQEGTEELRIYCSHNDSSLQVMLWYQHQTTLSRRSMSLIGYTVLQGDPSYEDQFKDSRFQIKGEGTSKGYLLIRRVNSSDSAVYFCAASDNQAAEAYFGGGTKLTVLEKDRDITPPTVKVLPPSTKECRNQKDGPRKKTIVCVASGFYPDHVSVKWKIDGIKATSGVATDNAALREGGYYRITSRLKVSGEDWFTLYKNFTCIVEFFDGTATIPYEDTVLGVEGEEGGMTRENYFKISQTAKLSYALLIIKSSLYGAFVAFLVWKLQRSTGKRNN